MAQLEDPSSELSRRWDEEHRRFVVHGLLEMVGDHFEAKTVEAFRLSFFDRLSAAEVGKRLKMSAAAAWKAKSRVLFRLRQEGRDLFD